MNRTRTTSPDAPAILVVGSTPPPWGGQAVMTGYVVGLVARGLQIRHIRTRYSESLASTGQPSLRKLFELIRVIIATYSERIRGARILYYCPAGKSRVPLVRDAIYLLACRPVFSATVLHFHAGGCADGLEDLSPFESRAVRAALARPDLGIKLGKHSPPDPERLGACAITTIPNGVEDNAQRARPDRTDCFRIVNISLLSESKGTLTLLRAFGLSGLAESGGEVDIVGEFHSKEFERHVRSYIRENSLDEFVHLHGRQTGRDKFRILEQGSVYCFPTRFEHENMPVSVIEAMSVGLPIVASRWRALPDLVCDKTNGYLVEPDDVHRLAEILRSLREDRALAEKLGCRSRTEFERRFKIDHFESAMLSTLRDIQHQVADSREQ